MFRCGDFGFVRLVESWWRRTVMKLLGSAGSGGSWLGSGGSVRGSGEMGVLDVVVAMGWWPRVV